MQALSFIELHRGANLQKGPKLKHSARRRRTQSSSSARFNWKNRMNKRPSPVPEGHATIAQRFNVGLISSERSSPEGTAETAREPSAVPSGLTTGYLSVPNLETLGYCRASLRDEEQFLVALELQLCANLAARDAQSCSSAIRLIHLVGFTFHARARHEPSHRHRPW